MRNPQVINSILVFLLLACLGQTLWIGLSRSSAPVLSRIESTWPLGDGGMLYGVVSDIGGATVPLTWRYYVHARIDDRQQALKVLREEGQAFLVTRDAKAVVEVQGNTIRVIAKDTVYSFHSSTLYRHADSYTPVTVLLTMPPADTVPGQY